MTIAGIDAQAPDTARARTLFPLLIGLLVLCAASMLYGGWLSDDYLIGLRQTLNLVHDRGFSFFASSRVQTMTSPLWGIVLAPVIAVLDVFYAPILFSIALSLGALAILIRHFWKEISTRLPLLVALAFLTWSRAFIDFSSSGLENPLAYVWVSWFFVAWLRFTDRQRQSDLVQVFASAALLCITRYDYAVLVAPSLGWAAWLSRRTKGLWLALLGFAGIMLPWLVFALIYYGTIMPNAFYAKLATAIPRGELIASGFNYLLALVQYDPASVILIALAIGMTLASRDRARWLHVLAGIAAYLAYAVMAGGDFMVGRFVSVPVVLCAGLVCRSLSVIGDPKRQRLVLCGIGACLLATAGQLPVLNNYFSNQSMQAAGKKTEIVPRINDEKNAYLGQRGLFSGHKGFASWLISKADQWREPAQESARRVVQIDCGGLGWLGFEYGPEADVYDTCALADPFMSKLPLFEVGENRKPLPWGPGHYTRSLPEGYQASLASGRNEISDPVLAEVYESVKLITAGELFDPRRWKAIYELATQKLVKKALGASTYDGVVHARAQRTYSAPYAEFSRLFRGVCTPIESASELGPADVTDLTFGGLTHAHVVRLTGTPHQPLTLRFSLAGQDVGQLSLTPNPVCDFGLGIIEASLPPTVIERGFDRMRISSADGKATSLGGVLLHGLGTSAPALQKGSAVLDMPACKLLHSRGQATSRCSIHVNADSSDTGHLMFGPYVPLEHGSYLFEIDYRVAATRGARAGAWDVIAHWPGRDAVLARGDLAGTEGAPRTLNGNFWVAGESTAPTIEIRMWPSAKLEAEAFALRIYRAAPATAAN